jgi:hypothetical protein
MQQEGPTHLRAQIGCLQLDAPSGTPSRIFPEGGLFGRRKLGHGVRVGLKTHEHMSRTFDHW